MPTMSPQLSDLDCGPVVGPDGRDLSYCDADQLSLVRVTSSCGDSNDTDVVRVVVVSDVRSGNEIGDPGEVTLIYVFHLEYFSLLSSR
jgi:hypothetical protein